nr:protein kinase, ATP binding site-containing protein [Tanacetum cinerariifolium]
QVVDGPKKVQFALGNDKRSHENEHGINNRVEVSTAPSHEVNEQNLHNMDVNISSNFNDEISSLLAKGTTGVQKHVSH